ncbi:MAG: YafY family protein [Anaerolineae bacterium]
MNRIDRLFATLLILQQKRTTAQALADKFEISQRTVYRDIAALSEMGVPIVALPGEGYELMEGFYLPPLLFTPAEATALFLGGKMLIQHAAGSVADAAQQALAKIKVALPAQTRKQALNLTGIIEFISPRERINLDDKHLLLLQQAIQQRTVVAMHYRNYQDQPTERDIEPYALSYADDAWYVSGYCRLRREVRTFRLSRIEQLRRRDATFAPRRSVSAPADERGLVVRVRFVAQVMPRVRERQHYAFESETPEPDRSAVIVTYRVSQADEILPWLLGWGVAAELLEPAELRAELRREVEKMLNMLT